MMSTKIWDKWNELGGPKYPHEKVVQFCFRNYPSDKRRYTQSLDLGCGSGVHTIFLAKEGFEVTGTDNSETGIDNTRQQLEKWGLTADLRVEGADVVDFPPDSFDLVICVGIYDSVGPSLAKASVERVAQVLRPGGRGLFLFASNRDFQVKGENPLGLYGYTRHEVEELFARGFSRVWIDCYITTYEGERLEQNDWLVTLWK